MASQIFNLKRYFGGDNDQAQDNSAMQNPQAPQMMQPQYPQQQIPQQPMQPMQQQPQMPIDPNMMQQAPQQQAFDPSAQASTAMDANKRQGLALLTHFSQRLNLCITQAAAEATRTKQPFIESDHLLYGLLYDSGVFKIVSDLGANPSTIQEEIKKAETEGIAAGTPQFSKNVRDIFESSYADAKSKDDEFISPEQVFFSLVHNAGGKIAGVLTKHNITKDALAKKEKDVDKKKANGALEAYSEDLTQKARDGRLDPIVGREKEMERIIHILSRRTKNNPVLVGEAGVGKTAVVEGLALKIVNKDCPIDLQNKRIVNLDLTSLVAGASHRGEFEERLKAVIKEVQIAGGEIILFIDELHNLVGAGSGEGTMDASNILKPFLARGEIQLIGTSTIDEYRRYIEKDPALERRFQQVLIEEPAVEDAIEMIKGLRSKYEEYHKVKITDEAVEAAVKLSKQYIGDRFLPDKAVDLIDEAGSKMRLNTTNAEMVVSVDTIEDIVSSWTGIPISRLTETESGRLLNLENLIHSRLIDQEGAVGAIAEAVRRGRAGLKSNNRPIGSFLFMGPTGVGKTELAKTLAEVLFGTETMMVRLDMTEYMEKHEVSKLIGAPPGFVGYEEGGQLTEAVRTKPYCVILLDEVEKAHPDVFNILIQVLEDGRLTDNKGRTVSFKNSIIICTSNLGTAMIQKYKVKDSMQQVLHVTSNTLNRKKDAPLSDAAVAENEANGTLPEISFEELGQKLLGELQKFFRPELLNRFDEIIVFKPLLQEHMLKIATININSTKKLLIEQKMDLEISAGALAQLSELGYDPSFGARPLRRVIQTKIENPISTGIIKQEFKEGDTILIDFDVAKNEFTFLKKAPAATAAQPGQPAATPQQPIPPGQPMAPAPAGQQQQQPVPPPQYAPAAPAQTNLAGQSASENTNSLFDKINAAAPQMPAQPETQFNPFSAGTASPVAPQTNGNGY